MSDDRLFASNNAIGRKWYYINLIILSCISYCIYIGFSDYVIPNTISETYTLIATWASYFIYLILLVTFFSLVERRLYDITGKRDTSGYKNSSSLLQFIILFQLVTLILNYFKLADLSLIQLMQQVANVLDLVFVLFVIIVGLFKGKISNISLEEYRKKDRYL